ncbi:hypothetical protein J437_LFUL001705 [Ladona fulva]|uniref:Eclosion hormone n=1 Tax=Ladona fulva TaxID=123851 RepID=A0A8K0K2J2_LADFU|nr:hypothetical protein J437_LFUL001705 [Ladona fulva]
MISPGDRPISPDISINPSQLSIPLFIRKLSYISHRRIPENHSAPQPHRRVTYSRIKFDESHLHSSCTQDSHSVEQAARQASLLLVLSIFLLSVAPLLTEAAADLSAVCLRNCAQCKKMFGPYFEGQLCAEACVKYNGQLVPECTDISSIAPFLNKFE